MRICYGFLGAKTFLDLWEMGPWNIRRTPYNNFWKEFWKLLTWLYIISGINPLWPLNTHRQVPCLKVVDSGSTGCMPFQKKVYSYCLLFSRILLNTLLRTVPPLKREHSFHKQNTRTRKWKSKVWLHCSHSML